MHLHEDFMCLGRILIRTVAAVAGVLVLACGYPAGAGEFVNGFSLQGYTGIMNTPTANVQKEGTFGFWYAKQRDHIYPNQHQDNYLFSTGFFSFIETGGRVAVGLSPSTGNDLSAQFKITTAPFTPKKYPWLPSLAFGMQDVGGQSNFYQTTYLVATEEISRLRLSVGYGFGTDRSLEGFFGGAEIKTFDWLYLLGEYGSKRSLGRRSWSDERDFNVGIRIVTPDIYGYPVNLHSTLKSALNNHSGTIDFTVGIQFSLGKDWHSLTRSIIPTSIPDETSTKPDPIIAPDSQPVKSGPVAALAAPVVPLQGSTESPSDKEDNPLPLKAGAEAVNVESPVGSTITASSSNLGSQIKAGPEATPAGVIMVTATRNDALRTLRDKLVADGFMHVRVGANDRNLLVVEYENGRYNQNQLDGMGVVLGMVVNYAPKELSTVRLVLKIQNINMLQVTMPIEILTAFFRDASVNKAFSDLVQVSYAIDDSREVAFVEEASFSSWFRSRLVLAPRLRTYVATEVSSFDYLLSFVPTLDVDLWKGAVLSTSADIPVAWSKGFDNNMSFYRNDAQMETALVSQALRIHPNFMVSLSGGMLAHEVYGTVNEIYWYSRDGSQRLGFQQGFGKDNNYNYNRTAYLGSYRYTYTPLDTSLTVTGGSFWENDTGVRADLSRFFGDTAFSVYYKYSRTSDNKDYQVGGVQIAFPLTPRRGMKPYPVQVKGTDEWKYALQSVTSSPKGDNSVFVSVGNSPPGVNSVTQVYHDRDRLTPDYVKAHLLRARDAYIRYVHPE
jgi:hypothetical protein